MLPMTSSRAAKSSSNRVATSRGARYWKDGRKPRRNRLVVAVVISTITALACLPILSHPGSTPLYPATPPGERDMDTMDSVQNSLAAPTTIAGTALTGGTHHNRPPAVEVPPKGTNDSRDGDNGDGLKLSESFQEPKGDALMGESGTKGEGGSTTSAVSYEGEGGKLTDGRDRCFTDSEGFHRCYPTVFFFGTSKCGTTSLAKWLDFHPSTYWVSNPRRPLDVEHSGVKEAHVFDDTAKGDQAFDQDILHDKLSITAPKTVADTVVIDYTPHYIAVAEAPYRIADMYGGRGAGLKFIVTLREPASRTISSWEFKNEFNPNKGRQDEQRSLAESITDGRLRANKLSSCLSMATARPIDPRERDLTLCNPRKFLEIPLYVSHVGKSMYAIQLKRWMDLFGRENFKVVFMDDMAVDPLGVIKDVLEFLGLEYTSEDESKGLPDLKRWKKITGMAYNKTKSKKKDELGNQVTEEIKNELRAFFEPYNNDLEQLIGRPIPDAWKYAPKI